jgi:uncharacterized protein with von Willebrand factor type A (vWA) domain
VSQILQIEAIAMRLTGQSNPVAPEVTDLVREWSRFNGANGPVDMGTRRLADLSEKWVQAILWKAQKAEKDATPRPLPLFDGLPPTKKKRAVRANKRPKKFNEWVATGVDPNKRGPVDIPDNHPDSIPF